MIGLAIPEDDTSPHTPLVTVAQGDLEAFDLYRAATTDALCLGQLTWLLREEELVAALVTTSSVRLQLL